MQSKPSTEAVERSDERKHLPSLDGIRAVAVVLVVLFHLQVPGFAGGFLGVDVFFVLSGFLITGLLLAEHRKSGNISLPAFWARRARRLLPALTLLLLAVTLSALLATPGRREALRGDLLWTTAYAANWHFIGTSAYFANTGTDSPLLHTWSLAIEEQFYLMWPLAVAALFAISRRPRALVAGLAAAATTVSLILLASLWVPGSPERAYMGTFARIFEPLIGALGAVLITTTVGRALLRRTGTPLAIAGVTAVAFCVWRLDGIERGYYVWGGLLTSFGTLAVIAPIALDFGGPVRKALAFGPAPWLGAISYGVYLWHWPAALWLGARDAASGAAPIFNKVAAAAAAVLAAWLSYTLVEQPIRRGRVTVDRGSTRSRSMTPGRVLVAIPVTMACVIGLALMATAVPPSPPGAPVVMMTGDSVPLRLRYDLEDRTRGLPVRFVSAAFGGCPVTGEVPVWPDGAVMGGQDRCPSGIVRVQDALVQEAHPDVVVWWDRFSLASFADPQGLVVRAGSPAFWSLRQAALVAAVNRLSSDGAIVLFVGVEPPSIGWRSRCISGGQPALCRWRGYLVAHFARGRRWNGMMADFAREHPDRASFLDLAGVVCHDDAVPCDDRIDGVTARPDGIHYEGAGADLAADVIWERIQALTAG